MNQTQFEHHYAPTWDDFEKILTKLEERIPSITPDAVGFPASYRRLCNHYALAVSRHYSPALVDRLHGLVLRGHRQLYKRKDSITRHTLGFIAVDFPQEIRAHGRLFWLAFALFFAPAILVGITTFGQPLMLHAIAGEQMAAQFEQMYEPGGDAVGPRALRSGDSEFAMFGFYIYNNISIGFRTFAGGIVFGLGTAFLLIYNGIFIGAVAGHLSHPPFNAQFWPFVSGHSSFELLAIVISGASGLRLGLALIRRRGYRRLDALRQAAPGAARLVLGAALMLLVAAFIEAFFSGSSLPPSVKYWLGVGGWPALALYFTLSGRRRRP